MAGCCRCLSVALLEHARHSAVPLVKTVHRFSIGYMALFCRIMGTLFQPVRQRVIRHVSLSFPDYSSPDSHRNCKCCRTVVYAGYRFVTHSIDVHRFMAIYRQADIERRSAVLRQQPEVPTAKIEGIPIFSLFYFIFITGHILLNFWKMHLSVVICFFFITFAV